MTELTIRVAQLKDLPNIFRLVQNLAKYERAEHEVQTSLKQYQNSFIAKDFEAFVAVSDSNIVGMALFYTAFSTWKGPMLYLEDFFVQESHRRRGIGRKLFDAVIEEAKKRSYAMVKWQVLDWNQPAIDFYKTQKATLETEWWNGKIIFK